MASTSEADFVVGVAQQIVLTVAPEEAPIFDLQAQAYRADPARGASGTTRDDPLGSAYGTIVPLVTPMAFELGKKVWEKLTEKTIDEALSRGGKTLLSKLRRRAQSDPPRVPTAVELDELHQEIILWAGELHWTPEQQTRAADATVSALARMKLAESGKAVGGAGEDG
jgi:hypothetical protein